MRTCRSCVVVAFALLGGSASAFEVGQSDYRFASDLSIDGFTPFATSGVGNTVFGMQRGTDQYLCFIADQADDQAERQQVLLAELAGKNPDRTVPNIPVVCILTQ